MGAPSWMKDGFGIALVLLCAGLYGAGVTHATPTPHPSDETIEAAVPQVAVSDCDLRSI